MVQDKRKVLSPFCFQNWAATHPPPPFFLMSVQVTSLFQSAYRYSFTFYFRFSPFVFNALPNSATSLLSFFPTPLTSYSPPKLPPWLPCLCHYSILNPLLSVTSSLPLLTKQPPLPPLNPCLKLIPDKFFHTSYWPKSYFSITRHHIFRWSKYEPQCFPELESSKYY